MNAAFVSKCNKLRDCTVKPRYWTPQFRAFHRFRLTLSTVWCIGVIHKWRHAPYVIHLSPRPYTHLSGNVLHPSPSLRDVIYECPLRCSKRLWVGVFLQNEAQLLCFTCFDAQFLSKILLSSHKKLYIVCRVYFKSWWTNLGLGHLIRKLSFDPFKKQSILTF